VSGTDEVGGLVGRAGWCRVEGGTGRYRNSCRNRFSGPEYRFSTITGSYAVGIVTGNTNVGGLVGFGHGIKDIFVSNADFTGTVIRDSYFNTDITSLGVGGGGVTGSEGHSTEELQEPTENAGIYAAWSSEDWDFGDNSQYPALKADLDGDGQATAWEFGVQGRILAGSPGQPVVSSVTPGPGSLLVAWNAPEGEERVNAYDLRYILVGEDEGVDALWTLLGGVWTGTGPLEYEVVGLTGGAELGVQVRAVNFVGDGPWSATARGTPEIVAPPGTTGATRSFSTPAIDPGGMFIVTISGVGDGDATVRETAPDGFSFVASDLLADQIRLQGQTIIFSLLGNDSFTYTVEASSVEGVYSFYGAFRPFGGEISLIGGDSEITVGPVPTVELSIRRDSHPLEIRLGSPVPVVATFSVPVTGFDASDVYVENGTVSDFVAGESGRTYAFGVSPEDIETVTVDIRGGAATDASGVVNTPAEQLSFLPYDDNLNGEIDRAEAITAINDYLNDALTRGQAIKIIQLYLDSRS